MSDFPSVAPNDLNFDMGRLNITEVATFAGPVRFRHSQRISGNRISLEYRGLSQQQIETFRAHFIENQGTHGYFSVPQTIWGGLSVASADASYRYEAPPVETHTGLFYNLSVSIRAIFGVNLSYILDGGNATLPATTAFQSFAFTGFAPFVLDAGDADITSPAVSLILDGNGA